MTQWVDAASQLKTYMITNPEVPNKARRNQKWLLALLRIPALCLMTLVYAVILRPDALARLLRFETEVDTTVRYLGVELPADATNVEHDACIGDHCYWIRLSFDASPDSVDRFTQGICRGVLLQGFDPFNAEYGPDEPTYPHVIDLGYGYNLFARSPDTEDKVFGNACRGVRGHPYAIRVDKTNLSLDRVKFVSCDGCEASHLPASTARLISDDPEGALGEAGLAIPADATHVWHRVDLSGSSIFLAFSAPPDSAEKFSADVCAGNLHQGFDPFAALLDGSHTLMDIPITIDGQPFMAFSPGTASTIFGKICLGKSGYIHEIRVDKSDPDLYEVRFELRAGCRETQPPLPCTYRRGQK